MNPPKFLSFDFHLKFFPSLLWRRVRPSEEKYRSPFAGHLPLEFTIVTFLSVGAAVWGFTAACEKGSISGWIFGILGSAVFVALLINSIVSSAGTPPTYESFRVEIFLFLVFLGVTAGLMLGRLGFSHSGWKLMLCGFAGLFPGYGAGILGGLWIQRLGWMSAFLDYLALVAIPGLVIVDIIMLI